MKKFYLGMDIGTDSVGMACTDEQYNLLRAKGKDLWAVRLFDEAKDASERRAKRTARRRLQRRRQRIDWLQDIFAPFMEDELFFIRLNMDDEEVTQYFLRHTFATVCQQYVRPDIVDIWMGDSSERLVGRVYTHFPDKFMIEQMQNVVFEI